MSFEINYSKLQNLENSLSQACFQPVDIREKIEFPDYLLPNETHPEGIKVHLNQVKKGCCVVTGTERMFFNAILADPKRLTGFIGRDFNPRVKAYNDYIIMLLKISPTRKKFKELASLSPELKTIIKTHRELEDSEELPPEFDRKIQQVKTLLEKSRLPHEAKQYYLTHLNDFAEVYYLKGKDSWKNPREAYFRQVHYHDNDAQWEQLRLLAIRGNLVATIGDIGDLSFLNKHRISMIDVSNIPSYILIDFRGQLIPHVIWTRKIENKTAYFMGNYTPLSDGEKAELDSLVATLRASGDLKQGDIGGAVAYLMRSTRLKKGIQEQEFLHCYSQQTLQWLRSYTVSKANIEHVG